MRNFLAGLLACAVMLCAGYGLASRNSSGTMSAVNGPYISGTPISSSIVNARLADIENELTDSLSRSGKGSMTAAMKEADGTVASPSYSFTNDTGSGLYRIGANNIGWAVNGVKRINCTTTGCVVTGTLDATGALGVTGDFAVATNKFNVTAASGNTSVGGTLAVVGASNFNTGSGNKLYTDGATIGGAWVGIWGSTAANSPSTTNYLLTTDGSSALVNAATGSAVEMRINNVTKAKVDGNGLTIGGGTAISAVSFGTCTLNGASPSTCTVTVLSGTTCICGGPQGAVCSVAATTATCSSGAGLTNVETVIAIK